MRGPFEGVDNETRRLVIDFLAFEEIIDRVIAHAQSFFIGTPWRQGFEIDGRYLVDQRSGAVEFAQ